MILVSKRNELKYKGYKGDLKSKKQITFVTILFAIYTAMMPLDQVMNFTGFGTINKYIGVLVIIALLSKMIQKKQVFVIRVEYLPILLFVLVSFLSYFWSIDKGATLSEAIRLSTLVCFYMVVCSKAFTDQEKTCIKVFSILGGVLVSLYMTSTSDIYNNRVSISNNLGEAADPNDVSTSLAFGALFLFDFLLREKRKINILIFSLCLFIILYGMMLTGSRGGMLGLILGATILIVLGLWNREISKLRILSLCLIGLYLLIFITGAEILSKYVNVEVIDRMTINSVVETGGTGRFDIWIQSMETASESLIFGYGFGAGPSALYKEYGMFVGTHNVLFFILLSTGIIGLMIFSFFMFNIIIKSYIKKDYLSVGMFIMLIVFSSTLDYLLNKNFWNVLIFSQIGLGVCHSNMNKEGSNSQ